MAVPIRITFKPEDGDQQTLWGEIKALPDLEPVWREILRKARTI